MDWDDIRYFLALAKGRTVKVAAKSLGVDASTVTRRLTNLEQKVGPLFERLGATYSLTSRGEKVLGSAERMAEEMSSLALKLASGDEAKTTVRVSFPTLLSSLVLDVVRGFSDERPDVTLALEASDVKVDLKAEAIDVVVRIEENPAEELLGRRVGVIEVGVYAAPSYLESSAFPIDDPRHAWIAWHASYAEKAPMRFLRDRFPRARVVSEGKSGEAVFQAIRAGLGIGALPRIVAAKAGLTELFCLPVDVSPSVWVLSADQKSESERVRAVRQRLFRLSETLERPSSMGDPRTLLAGA